jgi:hypothetical protein
VQRNSRGGYNSSHVPRKPSAVGQTKVFKDLQHKPISRPYRENRSHNLKREFVLVRVLSAFAFTGIANATPPAHQDGPVVQTAVNETSAKKNNSDFNRGDDQQEVARNEAGKHASKASKKDGQDPVITWGDGALMGNDPRFGVNPPRLQADAPSPGILATLGNVALPATPATAKSYPNWWAYAPPEATALVGIRWENLRHSLFAAAIEAAFSPSGALGIPDLDCLRQAREIVISSPELLAEESGSFPMATVRDQAQGLGLHGVVYRGLQLWLPEQADKLGVAQISEQLVLVGAEKTLQTAIDGALSEPSSKYSPLLTRAEFLSQTGDLWVVAVKLPDPLAALFVPLDANASEFLGQVSVRHGLIVQASFDAGSEEAAAEFVRGLQEKAPSFPAVARGIEAAADQSRVTIALQASSEELMIALHSAPAPEPARPSAPPGSAGPKPPETLQLSAGPAQTLNPVRVQVTHVEASHPRIIRIFNLDEGTRETLLPPAQSR